MSALMAGMSTEHMCAVGRYLMRSTLPDPGWNEPCPRKAVYCIPLEVPVMLCAEHTDQLWEVLNEAGLIDQDIVAGPDLDLVLGQDETAPQRRDEHGYPAAAPGAGGAGVFGAVEDDPVGVVRPAGRDDAIDREPDRAGPVAVVGEREVQDHSGSEDDSTDQH